MGVEQHIFKRVVLFFLLSDGDVRVCVVWDAALLTFKVAEGKGLDEYSGRGCGVSVGSPFSCKTLASLHISAL